MTKHWTVVGFRISRPRQIVPYLVATPRMLDRFAPMPRIASMESVEHLLLLVHMPIFLIGIRFCSCITNGNNRLRHLLKNGKYAIHDDETCFMRIMRTIRMTKRIRPGPNSMTLMSQHQSHHHLLLLCRRNWDKCSGCATSLIMVSLSAGCPYF